MIIRTYPIFILFPFLIGTQNPHCGFTARFWLIHFFFFISDTRKLRAHGATVEIYRTQGQLQKSNSSKFSNLKLRFGQFSDLCSVVNSRHVLTLSRRGWLHFTRGQREISQRAQVRGKQREEREGAPPKSFSFLPLQHWQIRLQR